MPHAAVVRLTYQGQGTAWFDGVLAEETVSPDETNLLPNGGFETVDKDWPVGWREPEIWPWSRREYYRFTGWSHDKGKMAGGAAAVSLSRWRQPFSPIDGAARRQPRRPQRCRSG